MTSLAAVTQISGPEAALSGLAKATDRARALETEADCVFHDLTTAQERCAEVGVNVAVDLTPGIAAAYSEWKRGRDKSDARQIAHEELGWPMREASA